MGYLIDPLTREFLWYCPQCEEHLRFHDLLALLLAEQARGCPGCQAKVIFEHNPELIDFFLDFWTHADAWPQSPSWTEVIPVTA